MNETRSAIQQYIENRFSVGLECYEQSLRRQGISPADERIVDVGCGPGQWSFAASRVAPNARVAGFDINREEIEHAQNYAAVHGFDRLEFKLKGYTDVLGDVEPESVDVVMCNGVIMYLDRDCAFRIFSRLLRPGGRLLMFHNHRAGYYLKKTSVSIRNFNLKGIYGYGVKSMLVNLPRQWCGANDGDSPLSLGRLQRVAARHGIDLRRIPTEPMLTYPRSFLGVPVILSVAGVKR